MFGLYPVPEQGLCFYHAVSEQRQYLAQIVPKRIHCLTHPVPDCGGDAAVADGVLSEELPFRHLRWIKSKCDQYDHYYLDYLIAIS
jgi:hypothetical protein